VGTWEPERGNVGTWERGNAGRRTADFAIAVECWFYGLPSCQTGEHGSMQLLQTTIDGVLVSMAYQAAEGNEVSRRPRNGEQRKPTHCSQNNRRGTCWFYGLPSSRGKRGIEATEKRRTGENDALLTEQSPWELLVLWLTKLPD